MATATLTTKGQITIPVAVREALGVAEGDRVEFVEVASGRFEVIAATRSITALKGLFGKPARSVSVEEMNEVIARHGAAAGDTSARREAE
jgi:AbrB family looped-hinge helix DNA binding protein